jgi:CheY-like chemotaxis protein
MSVTGKPLEILLIEDNEDHAEIVMRSLRSHRVANNLHVVEDGEAALDYLHKRGAYSDPKKNPRPDVILLDLALPKVDGWEVLKHIKQTDSLLRIPVVVLTSSENEHDIARAYDCHANSYLVKPVDFTKFTDLMRDLGFYWLGWNVNPFVQVNVSNSESV